MRKTIDKEGYCLYDGLRSHHYVKEGKICIDRDHTCWYLLDNDNGVIAILTSDQVKERIKDESQNVF